MNNSQFRAIPKNNFFKIPFKLEKKPLLEWLNKLSEQDNQKACLEVVYLLQALNKENISSKKRVMFLTTIVEYLKEHIGELETICWNIEFPLTIDERLYVEAITWNYLLISEGFFIASEDTVPKKDAAFALAMALVAIRKAQLHIAAVYSTPTDGFWQDIYKMYVTAEKRKLFNFKIWELKDILLETLFKKLFIFHACDTNQFRSKEMQTIFYFLESVCHNVSIDKEPHKDQALFIFDLESGVPPTNSHGKYGNTPKTARYFSPVIVAHDIYDTLKKIQTSNGALSPLHSALFLRVIKTLSLGQKRKYRRLTDGHEVSGVIGFDNIVNFLRKNKLPSTAVVNQKKNKAEKSSLPSEDLKLYIKHKNKLALEKDTDSKIVVSQAESLMIEQLERANANIEQVAIKKIHIFDSSAKGYSVFWNGSDSNAKAQIGDVFGIISEDKKRLEIAMIRRISMTTGNTFKFGSEIIGFKSEVVYIACPQDENQCTWAVFIPGIKELGESDTLIFSMGSFKTGDGIYIYRGGQKIKGLLVKELNSASGIILIELAYPIVEKESD